MHNTMHVLDAPDLTYTSAHINHILLELELKSLMHIISVFNIGLVYVNMTITGCIWSIIVAEADLGI